MVYNYTSESNGYSAKRSAPNKPKAVSQDRAEGTRQEARNLTAADLTEFDRQHWVTFARPASGGSGRPIVNGILTDIRVEFYTRGNMKRSGLTITVGFPSKWGGLNKESFGPLAERHPVTVGAKWVARARPEWDEEPLPPFPSYVKRVRVTFVDGPLHGRVEDIAVGDFGDTSDLRREDSSDLAASRPLIYARDGALHIVKGALHGGNWRVVPNGDEG